MCSLQIRLRSLAIHLNWLDGRVKAVEKQRNELAPDNFERKFAAELLRCIPGIDVRAAPGRTGQLPEPGKADYRSLANLVGHVPMNRDSVCSVCPCGGSNLSWHCRKSNAMSHSTAITPGWARVGNRRRSDQCNRLQAPSHRQHRVARVPEWPSPFLVRMSDISADTCRSSRAEFGTDSDHTPYRLIVLKCE